MTTSKFKEKLRQHIRRPIGLDELEAIAIEKGKVKPKQIRTGGGTSFTWDESEIPEVINQLNNN
jgi:hypothetical protein